MRRWLVHQSAKPLVFLVCTAPLAGLLQAAVAHQLGPNPAEALVRSLGDWALRLLWLTLAITPLRLLTRTPALARFRRMLGLWAFAYAALHLLAYAALDMAFDATDIVRDAAKRPFILVGLLAFTLLTALAATSFNRAMRWLGARRWQWLHRAVYAAALLTLLHFFWMRAGKNDLTEVGAYAAVLMVLLGVRAWRALARRSAASSGTLA